MINIEYDKFKGLPTEKRIIKMLKRIDKIKWFKPISKINEKAINLKVKEIMKAFKLDSKFKLSFHKLENQQDWTSAFVSAYDSAFVSAYDSTYVSARHSARTSAWHSARASARASARHSARTSAWHSARASARASARHSVRASEFEVVVDLMKKKGYKVNPFALLLDLWEMGFYVCGLNKNKEFVLYYVPKSKEVKK